jgi:hypothetical protein
LQTLSFVGDGQVLSAHGGGGRSRYDWHWNTTLWDVTTTPKLIGSFSETPIVSPDGEWLVTPLDSGALLGRISGGGNRATLSVRGDHHPISIVNGQKLFPTSVFSPDSNMLIVEGLYQEEKIPFLGQFLPQRFNPFSAAPSTPIVRVWDVSGHQELLTMIDCSQAWVSPDSSTLAALRENHFIDLWKPPYRNALWRVVGCASNCLLVVVVLCRLIVQTWKGGVSK